MAVEFSLVVLLVFIGVSCGGVGSDGVKVGSGTVGSQPESPTESTDSESPNVDLESSAVTQSSLSSGGTAKPDLPSVFPVDGEWRALFFDSTGNLNDIINRADTERSRRYEACMRAKGFEFSMGKPVGPEIDWRIAINPLNEATIEMGYHLPEYPDLVGETEITEEMERALDGGDIDPNSPDPTYPDEVSRPCNIGSMVEKLTDLGSIVDEQTASFSTDLSQLTDRYSGEPEAAKLTEEWSNCMKRQGYDYADPVEPRVEFGDAGTVEPREVEVRTADYECDLEVGLTKAKSVWQRQQYEKWLDENAAAIKEFEDAVATFSEELLVLESESL